MNQLVKGGLKNKTASEDMDQDSICNMNVGPVQKGHGHRSDHFSKRGTDCKATPDRVGVFFVFFLGTHGTWLFRIKKQLQGQKNGCGSWEFRDGDLILRKGKILKRS